MYNEGTYKAKATSWGFTETSNGYEQFWMSFDILGLADDLKGQTKPCDPGTGRWTITLTTLENAKWLMKNVKLLGYDREEDVLGLDPDVDGSFNFEGKEFLVKCKHEEYQGQTREKWSVVNPKPKLASAKLKALNDRFFSKKDAKKSQTIDFTSTTSAVEDPF